jgi:hypothetical protein
MIFSSKETANYRSASKNNRQMSLPLDPVPSNCH